MNDQILTIVVKSGKFKPSDFNEWFNEWSCDFFVDDYQCDIWWHWNGIKIYVPVDQIRPDKFEMLTLEAVSKDRRYPDTTDNPFYAIISTFLMRASDYEATNAVHREQPN